jgi:hypothetical protein
LAYSSRGEPDRRENRPSELQHRCARENAVKIKPLQVIEFLYTRMVELVDIRDLKILGSGFSASSAEAPHLAIDGRFCLPEFFSNCRNRVIFQSLHSNWQHRCDVIAIPPAFKDRLSAPSRPAKNLTNKKFFLKIFPAWP